MEINAGILCVHYYYPPIRSGGVLRNYFVSKEFAEIFNQCHIITTSNRDKLPSEDMPIPDSIRVYPVATYDFRTLLSNNKTTHTAENKKSFPGVQFLLRVQKSFPFNLFLAEGSLAYIVSGYKRGKKIITENNITHLYSSAFPYADHVISFLLKRKFPQIKWIADFRDLQIEPIYKNVVLPRVQEWCEEKILSKADLVTSVSEGLISQLEKYKKPTFTLMRGIELRSPLQTFGRFTVSYTGSMYRHYRDPSLLLEVLAELIAEEKMDKKQVVFKYAGRDGQQMTEYVHTFNLQDIYDNLGFISREESLTIQGRAHFNVVLTSSSPEMKGVITGKIFEYIESHRPVIVLVNGEYDKELKDFISSIHAGEVFYTLEPNAKKRLKSFIYEAYTQWQTEGSYVFNLNKKKINETMSWKHRVTKMLATVGT